MKKIIALALFATVAAGCITPQDKALWEETKTLMGPSEALAETPTENAAAAK